MSSTSVESQQTLHLKFPFLSLYSATEILQQLEEARSLCKKPGTYLIE